MVGSKKKNSSDFIRTSTEFTCIFPLGWSEKSVVSDELSPVLRSPSLSRIQTQVTCVPSAPGAHNYQRFDVCLRFHISPDGAVGLLSEGRQVLSS